MSTQVITTTTTSQSDTHDHDINDRREQLSTRPKDSPSSLEECKVSKSEIFEMSNLGTPQGDGDSAPLSKEVLKAQKRYELTGWGAVLLVSFMLGWNDGTSGPMLPTLQSFYHVNFAVVSLIFVINCIGFLVGAVLNVYLTTKIGFGKTLALGTFTQTAAYVIQGPAPPFPLFVAAYAFSGFGMSLQSAQSMVYISSLKTHAAMKMGISQACYGLGALVSPLVATHFAALPHWSFHYLVSLGISLLNVISVCAIFRFRHMEDVLADAGLTRREQSTSQDNHYSQILKLKVVHLISFFCLAYVGVEVTIGGWIVTFARDKRGGGVSSGYLTSGFFGGLMLGRIVLLWLNSKIGERRVVMVYIVLAIMLEIVVWFVPSLVTNAIAVAFVGLFLGPIYPIVMRRTGKVVPYWLLSGSMGWIVGFGQAGSALLPFITGTMVQHLGVMSLQPLVVSILATMVGLWAIIPGDNRRDD